MRESRQRGRRCFIGAGALAIPKGTALWGVPSRGFSLARGLEHPRSDAFQNHRLPNHRNSAPVAEGMRLVPAPGVFDGFLDAVLRGPAEGVFHVLVRGDQDGRVAVAAGLLVDRDGVAGDLATKVDDFLHRGPLPRAEVEGAGDGLLDREAVDVGEVLHVDVVAHGGAVGGGVVGAEDLDGLALAEGDFQNVGDEMGFDAVVFAAARAGAGGIEVAEDDGFDPVDRAEPVEDAFEGEFGFTVGVDGTLGGGLVDRDGFRNPVGGAGGGEDDLRHPGGDHRFEEAQSAADIVPEIFAGVLHGLADEGEGGEVDDGLGPLLPHGAGERGCILQVGDHEPGPRVDRLAVTFGEVVDDDDLMAGVAERFDADAANVAGATGD
jgi:hypothetical protein